jgi:DNA-binding transcriptional regulator YiaG
MFHAYDELFLNKARASMAHMLDFAIHDLRQDPDAFFALFISTGIAGRFGRGDYRLTAGMSGVELAYKVLEVSGIRTEHISYRYTSGRSREYWTGWALAEYQWETACTFSDIADAVSLRDMIQICDEIRSREIREISSSLSWMENLKIPDHMNESGYSEFRKWLDSAMNDAAVKSSAVTKLKTLRQQNRLSQSQLASLSGVPVRTIQQYEQRQKDINKASFESIIKLAAALGCEPYDLFDRH